MWLTVTKVLTSQNRTIMGIRTAEKCYQFFSIAGITGICGIIIPGDQSGRPHELTCATLFLNPSRGAFSGNNTGR
ncbi:uncharacterized protein EURHEDRAFT_408928 [Aspergillus ruber CBS 135680]|uniref:Uncharacterized protein n=1 Tax=Aspergillus ruber (strain CBS 135680) TaxID=1388766 RepID=A0A017SPQ7_ASPRC|nr:uncharacterized protein EURHEDRAFT_408928 [Aspergillus ruber CBS 135680]EYE98574.1 hypothetical protein EURHEDRAFT_408928 [Aspergillus ruber CBS 135680]